MNKYVRKICQHFIMIFDRFPKILFDNIRYFSHQVQQINLLLPIRNNFPVGGTINSRGWNILTTLANWENIIANMDYIFVALFGKSLHILSPCSRWLGSDLIILELNPWKFTNLADMSWMIMRKLYQNWDLGTAKWDFVGTVESSTTGQDQFLLNRTANKG